MMETKTKQPSEELMQLIKAAASSLVGFKELWGSIKKKGGDEGFSEAELSEMLKPYLKDKLNANQVKYLIHSDYYKEKSKQQYQAHKTGNITQNVSKKEPDKSDTPPPPKEKEEEKRAKSVDPNQDLYDDNEPEDDPKDTEIQFQKEKIAELEDALKKTTEFKPANQIGFTKEDPDLNTTVFRMGIKDFSRAKEFIAREMSDFVAKDFTAMKNRGWAIVEVTIKVL